MCIFYEMIESPVGKLLLAASRDGICAIYGGKQDGMARLKADFKGCTFEKNPTMLKPYVTQLNEYFSGKRTQFDVKFDIEGTPFQKKIWKALQNIPYGSSLSYSELARKAGAPNAVRAAGTACGSNPVPFIIPCHRVLRGDGTLGGFGLGLPIKKQLLAMEKENAQALASAA